MNGNNVGQQDDMLKSYINEVFVNYDKNQSGTLDAG